MKIIHSFAKTPGTRHYKYIPKSCLGKQNNIIKKLTIKVHRCLGRSSQTGRITVWHRGGGCKKLYRLIPAASENSLGILLFSCYDPNRSTFLSLYFDFLTLKFQYIRAITNLIAGSIIGCAHQLLDFKIGFRCWLKNHPGGSVFTNLNIKSSKTPQYALAAGTFCQLLQKTNTFCKIRLPSNKILIVPSFCFGTLGILSNYSHNLIKLGKAGRNRLKGKRPHVRGIAMNPVDHPHGGRTNGGCTWVTPWGKPCKGHKTVKKGPLILL